MPTLEVEITRTYQEVETGKCADRPELIKALAHAKRTRATLVIPTFDRLARNVAFTAIPPRPRLARRGSRRAGRPLRTGHTTGATVP